MFQVVVELLPGRISEFPDDFAGQHQANRHPSRKRDPPRPTALETLGVYVALDHGGNPGDVCVQSHILPWTRMRGQIQQARQQTCASGRIDDEVGLPFESRLIERFGRQANPIAALALHPRRATHDSRARPRRRLEQAGVEAVAGNVVGVADTRAESFLEAEIHGRIETEDKRRSRLEDTERGDLFFHTQLTQEGDHRRHE